jgi:hypothetical protein
MAVKEDFDLNSTHFQQCHKMEASSQIHASLYVSSSGQTLCLTSGTSPKKIASVHKQWPYRHTYIASISK